MSNTVPLPLGNATAAQHIPCVTETVTGLSPQAEIPPEGRPPMPEDRPVKGICEICGGYVKLTNYVHVVDPDYVEPETVTTTASTFIEPNRFDPFEALDEISVEVNGMCDDHAFPESCDAIWKQVNALRAYITGMKR